MKAISYISVLALLVSASCSSVMYTGAEYDDLYYLPSDRAAVVTRTMPASAITENITASPQYYDNIYAADTLVSDEYMADRKSVV